MKVHMRGINKERLYFIEELPINPSEGLPAVRHTIIFGEHKYLVKEIVWFIDKQSVILEVVEI